MKLLSYLVLPFIAVPMAAHSQDSPSTVHMQVLLSGSAVGTSDWKMDATGAFKAATDLTIGSLKISSEADGHFKGKHLADVKVRGKGPAGDDSLDYANGVLTVVRGGKTTTAKYTPKQDLYAGNLFPNLWRTSLDAAYAKLKDGTTGSSTTLSVDLVDVGAEVPAKFVLMPAKTVKVQDAAHVVRRFQISVASVQLELDQDSNGDVVGMDVPGQRLRMMVPGWDALYVDPLAAYPELSQPSFGVKRETNVRVKMRDGVALATDLIMPAAEGRYPAILIRTPYGRGTEDIEGDFYAKRGYVVVSQDCRGRGDSDGEWDPFVHEGDDGYDAIGWIAQQPWSDGNVGMIGGSYVGYVQWAAAVKHPPALKCIVPQVSPPDAMHNIPYEFGIPFLYADVWWAKIVAGKNADFSSLMGPLPNAKGLAALPLSKVDKETLGRTVPFYQKWLSRTTEKDWAGWDFLAHMDQADVPALHISGWFDGDGIGTKMNWARERELGRKDQWLIEGPWSHAFNSSSSIGKMDFGPTAILELDSLYLRWFDTWLKHKDVGIDKVPHVRVFVTGSNKWVSMGDWPDTSETVESLYLSKNALRSGAPSRSAQSYTYDPAKDHDTSVLAGGNGAVAAEFDGTVDVTKSKQPYLLFKSAPLARDTAIAGPATIDLYFKSTARDTDFYGAIVDVDPAGKVHVFGEGGKVRASYRDGVDSVKPLVPGRTYHVRLMPWDFADEIKKGHRIGVLLTPTGFPMFARNLGTGEPPATAKRMVAQHNTLLFGKATPSRVTFHVLW